MKTATILFFAGALLLSLLSVPALATDEAAAERSEEAIEILKKADEKARQIDSVRLTVSSKPTGLLTNFVGPTEGDIVMQGWNEDLQRPQKFHCRVKTERQGQAMDMTGGGDGEMYFLVDHTTKKAYEDMDPGVLGSGAQALFSVAMLQFVQPDPFQRDIDAPEVKLLGKENVDGEECYQIAVTYPQGAGESGSTWSIAASDYLPRRLVRHFNFGSQGEGTLEVDLKKVEVAPKVDASLFKMQLPEGYEQIDDFAP